MELRHLRVFLALSEQLHFGRTAARLHVAQSAVSQTLRDLEEELGARLLERSSRQVQLTAAGQAFVSYAREALQAVEHGRRAAQAAHGHGGRLRLRLLAAAALGDLPTLLRRLLQDNPLTVLEVRDGTSARNLEALEGGFCDVAFLSLASAKRLGPGYDHRILASGALGVVLPTRHRLAKREAIRLEDLRDEKIVCLQRDEEPDVRTRLDARLASAGATLTAIELAQPRRVLPFVAAGLGVAILPCFVTGALLPGLRMVPLAGPVQGGVVAAWNKQQASPLALRLVKQLASQPPR